MKAVVAAFNQEKALVGAFSVITNLRKELFEALTWSPSRGRSWGRGSWTGSWAAAAHTPAAGRSCSRSENITITSRKYLLEKQLLYYFSYFLAIYSVDATLELLVGTCDRVELLDHCIGGIVALQHHCNNIATCSFPIP